MLTDKELLELAAKAAGIELCKNFVIAGKVAKIKGTEDLWAPLTDDGDALRLAVKLKIDVLWYDGRVKCEKLLSLCAVYEPQKDDPYAATRRAIVRAAAEIGRAME